VNDCLKQEERLAGLGRIDLPDQGELDWTVSKVGLPLELDWPSGGFADTESRIRVVERGSASPRSWLIFPGATRVTSEGGQRTGGFNEQTKQYHCLNKRLLSHF